MIPKGELDKYNNIGDIEFTGERVVPGKTPYVTYQEHINRYVFALKFVKNKIILDVACGTGYGTDFLVKNGAKKAIGLDISTDAINYAKNVYKKQNLSFIQGNSINLPFHDKSFDVIISFETIEHIKEHDKFLNECWRVLRNGGLFICSTPNKRVSSPYTKKPSNPFHVKEFYIDEFSNLLDKYFVENRLYSQNNVNLIKKRIFRLGGMILSVIPMGNVIKSTIKKLVTSNKNFCQTSELKNKKVQLGEIIDMDYKVSNLKSNQVITPTFIIAVAKKGENKECCNK